jgi:lipoprotein-anchoring transpeptidase ErfK/SrfK
MRGVALIALVLAGCLLAGTNAAAVGADPPAAVPAGVTIAGVPVGGLAPTDATAAVTAAFTQPLRIQYGRTRILAAPDVLGASADVNGAVAKALTAQPGTALPLPVTVDSTATAAFVAQLAQRFDRPAVDSRLLLRHLRPFITVAKKGTKLDQRTLVRALVTALTANRRGPVALQPKILKPKVTRGSFGPVIVIRRGVNHLFLYRGMRFWREFGVATGQTRYPTPLGRFTIVTKWRNPWWYPPASPWAQGQKPIPPGPNNPLGTRWMGLSAPGVGIHGTPSPGSIGYSVSHGCIRMLIPDAEWLFNRVMIGTPVFIVAA